MKPRVKETTTNRIGVLRGFETELRPVQQAEKKSQASGGEITGYSNIQINQETFRNVSYPFYSDLPFNPFLPVLLMCCLLHFSLSDIMQAYYHCGQSRVL